MTTKIEITPEMREFNEEIADCDAFLGRELATPNEMVLELWAQHCLCSALTLKLAAQAVGYTFPAQHGQG